MNQTFDTYKMMFPAEYHTVAPIHFWLHVYSSLMIGLSFYTVAGILGYLLLNHKRKFPGNIIYPVSGLFIVACGTVHILNSIAFFYPVYKLLGIVKFTTFLSGVFMVGTILYYIRFIETTILEVYHRKEKDEKLRIALETERENKRYALLAESIPHIVWTANPDGAIDYYNKRWEEYTGISADLAEGWGWREVVHPDDLPTCLDKWTTCLRTLDNYEVRYRLRRHDGIYRWHVGRAYPVRVDGEVISWFGTNTDIEDGLREAMMAKSPEMQELRGLISGNPKGVANAE